MSIIVVFWLSKIEISWKIAKKVDFRIFLAPIWGFSTKKGFTFRESPNFVIPFGTKNHEMGGPPVTQGPIFLIFIKKFGEFVVLKVSVFCIFDFEKRNSDYLQL